MRTRISERSSARLATFDCVRHRIRLDAIEDDDDMALEGTKARPFVCVLVFDPSRVIPASVHGHAFPVKVSAPMRQLKADAPIEEGVRARTSYLAESLDDR